MIRPYLSDMIIDYKTQGEWKIQLTMSINFISSIDSDETRNLRVKSINIEIIWVMKQMKLLMNSLSLFYKIIKKV